MSCPLREEALAQLRPLLAELRGRVLEPLLSAAAEPPALIYPPTATPERDFLDALLQYRSDVALSLPPGATVEFAGGALAEVAARCVGVVERLCWLLGLSDIEREFVLAAGSADPGERKTALAAYADWLEERGRGKGGDT